MIGLFPKGRLAECHRAESLNESLGECVRSWRSNGCLDDSDALGAEHLVETGGELRISVTDKELGCSGAFGKTRGEVASLLDDPLACWVGGDAGEVDPSSVEFDEEQRPYEVDVGLGECPGA